MTCMNFSGWKKHFADETCYIGRDTDVYAGKASWKKSRLDNIVKVELCIGKEVKSIMGLGEYWQSDSFESIYPGGCLMTNRRIQKKINQQDICYVWNERGIVFGNLDFPVQGNIIPVCLEDIGKWLVLEYDMRSNQWRHYLSRGAK